MSSGKSMMIEDMLNDDKNIKEVTIPIEKINGWDIDAKKTIKNWFKLFKEYRYIYQYIYDRNIKRASILNILSAISSVLLGILSAFKLWQENNPLFQITGDILLMLFNFLNAIIISVSKRLLDDVRNEQIRKYIEKVDNFLGIIAAQVLKSPIYRMNAIEFFSENNEIYTKLITSAPNLTLKELRISREKYNDYLLTNYKEPIKNLSNDTEKYINSNTTQFNNITDIENV
jgi:hypothetical protein